MSLTLMGHKYVLTSMIRNALHVLTVFYIEIMEIGEGTLATALTFKKNTKYTFISFEIYNSKIFFSIKLIHSEQHTSSNNGCHKENATRNLYNYMYKTYT